MDKETEKALYTIEHGEQWARSRMAYYSKQLKNYNEIRLKILCEGKTFEEAVGATLPHPEAA